MEYLQQRLRVESLDAESVSRFLLSEQESQRVAEIVGWMQWGRRWVPRRSRPEEPSRRRGTTIDFSGRTKHPRLLVQQMIVDGHAHVGGRDLSFEALVHGLTSAPKITGRPTTLAIRTTGDLELIITAIVDRTSAEPVDRYVIHAPRLVLPARRLGKADMLTLDVAPSDVELTIDVSTKWDELTGTITIVEQTPNYQVTLGSRYGGEALAAIIRQSLAEIDTTVITIDVTGTIRQPRWALSSDLGDQLAGGLRRAVRHQLESHHQQLLASLDQRSETVLAGVDGQIAAKVDSLLAEVETARADIASLASPLLGRLNTAERLSFPEAIREARLPFGIGSPR
jgi:uncharacterized protein (TIGR03545 family)